MMLLLLLTMRLRIMIMIEILLAHHRIVREIEPPRIPEVRRRPWTLPSYSVSWARQQRTTTLQAPRDPRGVGSVVLISLRVSSSDGDGQRRTNRHTRTTEGSCCGSCRHHSSGRSNTSVVASFSFSLLSFGAAEEEDDEEETHEEGTTHTIDEHTTKMRRRRPSTPTTTESKHRRSKTSPEPDKDAVHINDEPPPPQQQQSINTRTAVGYRNELQTRETSWTATGKAADAFAGTRQRRSTRHPRRNVRYQDQYPRSYAHPRLGSMRIGIVTYGGGSNAPVVPCSRNYRHGGTQPSTTRSRRHRRSTKPSPSWTGSTTTTTTTVHKYEYSGRLSERTPHVRNLLDGHGEGGRTLG